MIRVVAKTLASLIAGALVVLAVFLALVGFLVLGLAANGGDKEIGVHSADAIGAFVVAAACAAVAAFLILMVRRSDD